MNKKIAVTHSTLAAGQMYDHFLNQTEEKWVVMYLDAEGKPIDIKDVEGGFDIPEISIKEVAKLALTLEAEGIVIAHNHVGKSNVPTREDLEITRNLGDALRPFNVAIFDHR